MAESTRTHIERVLARQGMEGRPVVRRERDGQPVITDESNYLLDLALEEIHDAPRLARALNAIAGVVEHGLFLNICQLAIIGRPDGSVVELLREDIE